MPIGGVLATKGVVVPNAVGVDIGCGMCAVKTNVKVADITQEVLRKKILRGIRKQIPLGRAHHKIAQPEEFMPQGHNLEATVVVARQQMSAMKQIGTLGGGNHFIELQRDEGGQPMDNDPLGLAQSRQTGGRLLQREGRGTEPSMVLIGSLRNTIAVSAHAHRRVPPILGRDELLHRLRSRQPPTDDAAHPGSDRRSYARHRI